MCLKLLAAVIIALFRNVSPKIHMTAPIKFEHWHQERSFILIRDVVLSNGNNNNNEIIMIRGYKSPSIPNLKQNGFCQDGKKYMCIACSNTAAAMAAWYSGEWFSRKAMILETRWLESYCDEVWFQYQISTKKSLYNSPKPRPTIIGIHTIETEKFRVEKRCHYILSAVESR